MEGLQMFVPKRHVSPGESSITTDLNEY